WNEPVADVEAEDVAGGSGDLRIHLGVPPDVIDIDDHADAIGVETANHCVHLGERHDDRAFGGVHRVQRFDAEFDAALKRVREQGGDRCFDVGAGRCDIPVRCGSTDQYQHVGAQFG